VLKAAPKTGEKVVKTVKTEKVIATLPVLEEKKSAKSKAVAAAKPTESVEEPKVKKAKVVAAPAEDSDDLDVAPKKRGRKKKGEAQESADALPEAEDGIVDADPDVVAAEAEPPKKNKRQREKAMLKAFAEKHAGTSEDLETKRNKLKVLIKLGKDRGFLTYGEINDHLPNNIIDSDAIDQIIGTFNDMGIAVYEVNSRQ
jgi:RNA polymerase primary sigma factor